MPRKRRFTKKARAASLRNLRKAWAKRRKSGKRRKSRKGRRKSCR